MKKALLILFFGGLFSGLSAQTKTPNQILDAVYKKLLSAKDYTVEANIKVDIPFVKMLPIDAKIYYKQKDKFKVESKSIAIVPRQGFDQVSKMLYDTNSFTAVVSGSEKIGNTQTTIISIIPPSDTTDLILGKLWIDPVRNVVIKSQLTTKSNGTILTEYTYGSQVTYGLPDAMVFTVDIKKFKMPKSVAADVNKAKAAEVDPKNANKKGKIYITLTSYQVNKGIPDSIFTKKE